MSRMNLDHCQVLRQRIGGILKGKSIHDGVGALEMVLADLLMSLPGASERSTLAGLGAIASDVRNIITERYAAEGTTH